jgi:hypothetical protein
VLQLHDRIAQHHPPIDILTERATARIAPIGRRRDVPAPDGLARRLQRIIEHVQQRAHILLALGGRIDLLRRARGAGD